MSVTDFSSMGTMKAAGRVVLLICVLPDGVHSRNCKGTNELPIHLALPHSTRTTLHLRILLKRNLLILVVSCRSVAFCSPAFLSCLHRRSRRFSFSSAEIQAGAEVKEGARGRINWNRLIWLGRVGGWGKRIQFSVYVCLSASFIAPVCRFVVVVVVVVFFGVDQSLVNFGHCTAECFREKVHHFKRIL